MTDPRSPAFKAVAALCETNPFNISGNIARLHAILDDGGAPRSGSQDSEDPPWVAAGRSLIGLREIPGPRHNNKIVGWWRNLGAAWFSDDETPWCGAFVAHCIHTAGLDYPKMFPRAKAWASWGKTCPPQYGAVAVFGRSGGGHVGFLVGASRTNYYVLGGNQSNMVSIMPVAKSRLLATRWPAEMASPHRPLPVMSGGVVSTNEA